MAGSLIGYVGAPGALKLDLINYLSESTSKEDIQDPTHSQNGKTVRRERRHTVRLLLNNLLTINPRARYRAKITYACTLTLTPAPNSSP